MKLLALLVALLWLAACSEQTFIDKLATSQEQQTVKQLVQAARAGDVPAVDRYSQPALSPQVPKLVAAVRPVLRLVPGDFKIVGLNVFKMSGELTRKNYTLIGGAGDKWASVTVVMLGTDAEMDMAGFWVQAWNSDPLAANDFSNGQAGGFGYFVLAIAVISFVTCVTAVTLIWRRKWLKKRWL
ncbi:hypothetical protein SPAN111604_01680 [Sphingomonas antarctica]|uniref:hypothetical protein n=1 Tax=Sphingomonas antarctica TaxID=2040274 RepID=UPI0039E8ACC0